MGCLRGGMMVLVWFRCMLVDINIGFVLRRNWLSGLGMRRRGQFNCRADWPKSRGKYGQ